LESSRRDLLGEGLFGTSRAGAQGRIRQLLQYIFGVATSGTPVRINGHRNFSTQEDEDRDTPLGGAARKTLNYRLAAGFQDLLARKSTTFEASAPIAEENAQLNRHQSQ